MSTDTHVPFRRLSGATHFGPVAGVLTEFVKILIKLLLKPTTTAFVGELANFCVGCSMILPATILYHIKKKKATAIECLESKF